MAETAVLSVRRYVAGATNITNVQGGVALSKASSALSDALALVAGSILNVFCGTSASLVASTAGRNGVKSSFAAVRRIVVAITKTGGASASDDASSIGASRATGLNIGKLIANITAGTAVTSIIEGSLATKSRSAIGIASVASRVDAGKRGGIARAWTRVGVHSGSAIIVAGTAGLVSSLRRLAAISRTTTVELAGNASEIAVAVLASDTVHVNVRVGGTIVLARATSSGAGRVGLATVLAITIAVLAARGAEIVVATGRSANR